MNEGRLLDVSNKKIKEEIEIYHDEVYDNKTGKPFGHQFVIIPIRSKDVFNEALMEIREKYKANNLKINWKELRERYNINRNKVAEYWLNLLYNATHNSSFKFIKTNKEILITKNPLGLKIGSIFIKSLDEMSDDFWIHVERSEDKTKRKYETILRIGIKGCLHYFFNPKYTNYSEVLVKNFYTDGKVFGRVKLNKERILRRLENEIRNYIKFDKNIEIIPVIKSKNKTPEVNFEELTDVILGATCYLCGDEKQEKWKNKIVSSLKEIYKKSRRGKNIRKSGHYRCFSITQWDVKNNNFEELNIGNSDKQNNTLKLSLNF